MSYVAVLDVSSVVWDPAEYEAHTNYYYDLKDKIFDFIETVEVEKPPLLMRSTLIDHMINGFPFSLMPSAFYDFGNIMFKFLGNMAASIITFNADSTFVAKSNPEVLKAHYTPEIIQEVQYILNEMHKNNDLTSVYFTFKYLWKENNNLSTKVEDKDEKNYQTVKVDDGDSLKEYFKGFKKVFSHSPKHHPGNKNGNYISPLTCYKNNDSTLAQKYLDNSFQVGSKYFALDEENDIYVVFFRTGGNEYHGHDEIDVNKIPAVVRKKFKK